MAVFSLASAATKTSGRTIVLTFSGGGAVWPTCDGADLTVNVNGSPVDFQGIWREN